MIFWLEAAIERFSTWDWACGENSWKVLMKWFTFVYVDDCISSTSVV